MGIMKSKSTSKTVIPLKVVNDEIMSVLTNGKAMLRTVKGVGQILGDRLPDDLIAQGLSNLIDEGYIELLSDSTLILTNKEYDLSEYDHFYFINLDKPLVDRKEVPKQARYKKSPTRKVALNAPDRKTNTKPQPQPQPNNDAIPALVTKKPDLTTPKTASKPKQSISKTVSSKPPVFHFQLISVNEDNDADVKASKSGDPSSKSITNTRGDDKKKANAKGTSRQIYTERDVNKVADVLDEMITQPVGLLSSRQVVESVADKLISAKRHNNIKQIAKAINNVGVAVSERTLSRIVKERMSA
jgi:hypothetical protein